MWIAEADQSNTGGPALLTVLIVGGIIYTFGYLRAVMHRANADYKDTKAKLPGMRKGYWLALWAAVKIGFWVFVAVALLIMWTIKDARNNG